MTESKIWVLQPFVGERRYIIDGNERPRTIGNLTGRAKADWNGKQLIITSWFENGGNVVKENEIWDLADDQKTIVLTREHGDSRAKTIFKKQ